MKIRNKLVIITALCLVVIALGSCDYWEPADQGSINISFDDSNARAATLVGDMIYTITLTSPGKGTITRTTEVGETFISIPVSGGAWSIHVQGEGARRIGEGTAYVSVTAGKPAPVFIKMNVTSTKAHSYEEIVEDFKDDSLPAEFIIEIFGEELIAHSSGSNESSNIAILSNGKTITLRAKAKSGLTIKRQTINDTIHSNVFRITNGTLILDGETGGTITLNGMKDDPIIIKYGCERALINVEDGSATLTMLGGVTLTNNTTKFGGGVYIKGSNSYFYMYGGIISKNKATDSGGGVYIASSGGHFIKTIGIVYGNDAKAGNNANNASSDSDGHAVFQDHGSSNNNVYENNTLGEDDPWTKSP